MSDAAPSGGATGLKSRHAARSSSPAPPKPSTYEFDPSKGKSVRGQAHAAALHQQQFEPLMPVPLLRHKGWLVVAAIACALFAFAVHITRSGNLLLTLRPHHFEHCRIVKGPVGAEDIALDPRGVAFVSSDARQWVPQMGRDGFFTTSAKIPSLMAAVSLDEQGALYAYDARPAGESTTAGTMTRLEIEGLPPSVTDMHPHGIHIPRSSGSPAERTWLYVLNHQRDGDRVLVLEVEHKTVSVRVPGASGSKSESAPLWPPRLVFRGLISGGEAFTAINDLVSLYPLEQENGSTLHSMYISNFLGSRLGDLGWNVVETFLHRPWGSVALCQARLPAEGAAASGILESNCTVAIGHLVSPNGLALSLDQRNLYVAQTLTHELNVFELPNPAASAPTSPAAPGADERSWVHGSLRLLPLRRLGSQHLATAVDNLDQDPLTGDLFIGAHPKLLDTLAHQEEPTKHRAPTQVLRLRRRTEEERSASSASSGGAKGRGMRRGMSGAAASSPFAVREVHLSSGEAFSGSSVGVWSRRSKELLIGGVSDDGIYVCPYEGEESDRKQERAQAQEGEQDGQQ